MLRKIYDSMKEFKQKREKGYYQLDYLRIRDIKR